LSTIIAYYLESPIITHHLLERQNYERNSNTMTDPEFRVVPENTYETQFILLPAFELETGDDIFLLLLNINVIERKSMKPCENSITLIDATFRVVPTRGVRKKRHAGY
jgi:hypothetical protein